jgi:hypothetical protein
MSAVRLEKPNGWGRMSPEPKTPPEDVRNTPLCVYLDNVTDLTPEMMDQTVAAYDANSSDYASRVEWATGTILSAWNNVIHPLQDFIQSIQPDEEDKSPRAFLAGAGTLRDVKMLAELNLLLDIVAFDTSLNQLEEGLAILDRLGVDPSVLAVQARMPDFFMPAESFDLGLIVAALQHLSKAETLQTIESAAGILKEGAKLYCDVRLDTAAPGQNFISEQRLNKLDVRDIAPGGLLYQYNVDLERGAQSHGRVFMDTILTPGAGKIEPYVISLKEQTSAEIQEWMRSKGFTNGMDSMRFYNTYSLEELYYFVVQCAQFGLRIDTLGFNFHPTREKPPFVRIIFDKASR